MLNNTDDFVLSHDFLVSSDMIFAEKCHHTSSRTILSDNVAVGLALINVIALDDIGMIKHFKNLNLILQQLHRRRRGLTQSYDFNGIRLTILRHSTLPVHYIGLVDLTGVSPANLVVFVIVVASDLFVLVGLVVGQTDCALKVMGGLDTLAE